MAGSASSSHYSFNHSGLLLAHWSEAGVLKIWDASVGAVKQEYTKNLHLTSPCTCIYWLQFCKRVGPKKKKLKSDGKGVDDNKEILVLGTSSGNILLYDPSVNDVTHVLEHHTGKVNSLSWSSDFVSLFSCSDDKSIVEWDVENLKIKSKWKTGNETVYCLLALSNGKQLLTASYSIKLWDLGKKQVVHTFVGHATEVSSLIEMPGHEDYFVSSAKGDRVLSAWSLGSKEKNTAVASFILRDSPSSTHVQNAGDDSPPALCAVTESGVVQIFKHKLNGNVSKPVKPFTSISVSARDGSNAKHAHPLSVYAMLPLHNGSIVIAYGTASHLQFETLCVNDIGQENLVLVREGRKTVATEFNSKVKIPEVNESTEYEAPTSASVKRSRKKKLDVDVPLEERLENLALANTLSADAPKKDNMAQLLIQGLQSKDKTILETVLYKTEEAVVNGTVRNLPVQALVPLVRELTGALASGKDAPGAKIAVGWLTSVLRFHSGALISNRELANILEPLLSLAESRLSLLPSLLRLRGRLNLVADQIEMNASDDVDRDANEPLISYQEQDSSDDGEIDVPSEASDSDENWDGLSEMEDQDDDIDET